METVAQIACPACSFEQDDGVETCLRCGVVFAKLRTGFPPRNPAFASSSPVAVADRADPAGKAWKLLAAGSVAAIFVQIQTMQFAWKLTHDDAFLAWYRGGKGGAMMNDLEVIALDLKIWTGASFDIEHVARGLLAFSLVPVALAVLLFVFRERVNAFSRSLLLLDPD